MANLGEKVHKTQSVFTLRLCCNTQIIEQIVGQKCRTKHIHKLANSNLQCMPLNCGENRSTWSKPTLDTPYEPAVLTTEHLGCPSVCLSH